MIDEDIENMRGINKIECSYFTEEELEILYNNRIFLETILNPSPLAHLLYAASGEKRAFYGGPQVLEPKEGSKIDQLNPITVSDTTINTDDIEKLFSILDELDVFYMHRIEYDIGDESTDYCKGNLQLFVTKHPEILTDEDIENFTTEGLSHARMGELLGYPEDSVEAFSNDEEHVSRETEAELHYQAIKELGVDGLPHVHHQEQIPITYYKSVFHPSFRLYDTLEDYKQNIKYYLELTEFCRVMALILDSDHIRQWDLLTSDHCFVVSKERITDTDVIDRFKKLQEEYVVNNGKPD